MLQNATQNLRIIISLLIVIAMGFLFKFYSGFAHQWFNNYAAAIFYEIFWCLFVFLLVRNRTVMQIPLWVFGITCTLEFLQLWHPLILEQFRATFVGRLLIGTTFSWWDFLYYGVGCFLGWFWLRQLKASNAKTSQS